MRRLHSVGYSMAGELARIVSSLALFLLLVFSLGVDDYGYWAGSFALASFFVPLISMGAGHVASRRIPLGIEAPWQSLAFAYSSTLLGLVVGIPAFAALSWVLLGSIEGPLVASLIFSELCATALVEVSCQVAFASNDARRAFLLRVSLAAPRLIAAVFFIAIVGDTQGSLDMWAVIYAGSTFVGLVVAALVVARWVELRRLKPPTWSRLREGLPYSLNLAALYAQDDLDKALLLGQVGPAPAGLYAAAFRVVSLTVAPVRAVLNVAYPRFFSTGMNWPELFQLIRKLLAVLMVYGAVVGGLLFVTAPMVADLLGPSYDSTARIIQMLAFLPMVRSLSFVLGNAVSGSGAQPLRGLIHIIAAFISVTLNLMLLGSLSYVACVVALAAAEAFTIGAFTIILIIRRGRKA